MGPYVLTALCARELHKRDVQYIVRDGEVKIVNSKTGRVLPMSRWMDDLHQVHPCLPFSACWKHCRQTLAVENLYTLLKDTCRGLQASLAAQAIEAQEPGVEIKGVTRAVSSITYQTLFKYYPKLSGMTVSPAQSSSLTLASMTCPASQPPIP